MFDMSKRINPCAFWQQDEPGHFEGGDCDPYQNN
jgi:hypothetical protein